MTISIQSLLQPTGTKLKIERHQSVHFLHYTLFTFLINFFFLLRCCFFRSLPIIMIAIWLFDYCSEKVIWHSISGHEAECTHIRTFCTLRCFINVFPSTIIKEKVMHFLSLPSYNLAKLWNFGVLNWRSNLYKCLFFYKFLRDLFADCCFDTRNWKYSTV